MEVRSVTIYFAKSKAKAIKKREVGIKEHLADLDKNNL